MGTAPGQQQPPAMPSPGRVVSRSVEACQRLGLSKERALCVVITCADVLYAYVGETDGWAVEWVNAISEDASSRLAVLNPSYTDRTENDDADGRSSGAGRDT